RKQSSIAYGIICRGCNLRYPAACCGVVHCRIRGRMSFISENVMKKLFEGFDSIKERSFSI
ncbi:hypothetical protein, partial [Enterocloster clostridioformis]|uniref:hypothetical protein n=1 Tax=Enterocloster clostridioformis TaxID=1531 RepID=UPI001A9A3D89